MDEKEIENIKEELKKSPIFNFSELMALPTQETEEKFSTDKTGIRSSFFRINILSPIFIPLADKNLT